MAKFEAHEYSQFRVSYPEALFAPLHPYAASFIREQKPFRVSDLGGGTGISARSFLEAFPWAEVTVVEPDAKMLEIAKATLKAHPQTRFVNESAENYHPAGPIDLAIVGSAWHWMDRTYLLNFFTRINAQALFIFEYQFPKAKSDQTLNEWVRREFNLKWRTTTQVPRGTLIELTQNLRDSDLYREAHRKLFTTEPEFSLDAFFGMIISQSRYLAFEENLSEAQKIISRHNLRTDLVPFFTLSAHQTFLVSYESVLFRARKL